MTRIVTKRDGKTVQPFSSKKIANAVTKAWTATYGETPSEDVIDALLTKVVANLPETTSVSDIENAVEKELSVDHFSVAKAYILHREKRTGARKRRPNTDGSLIASYIHSSKYARYDAALGRRETYDETVMRVENMHIRRFPMFQTDINAAFDLVRAKRVLPSMRSMQFGGAAVEVNNNRLYNCSFTLIDRPRVFAEALYLLLCGCGVGYSVQQEHVDMLPYVARVDVDDVVHHIVADTIEGWGDALDALASSYLDFESPVYGRNVEFSFHEIRRRGTPLKTSGGRAPGHRKLKESLERIRGVFEGARGRKLRPIECHRILCHAADAVLSGGIRRSAMLCMFSITDNEMMACKADSSWFSAEPWLANANNSAACIYSNVTEEDFQGIFRMARKYGEPGSIFTSDAAHGYNPCTEVGMDPQLDVDGTLMTGWSFCNLCEINGAKIQSESDFREAAIAATVIGTLQASYTSFPYLGPVSEAIARRDALIGIGITGMQDSPAYCLDYALQSEVAKLVRVTNQTWADRIHINSAARTTVIKPSGTTSLELGSVGSGIHAHHARRYIRRVTADELEIPFQAFRLSNPHACVRKPDGKWVIEFAVEAPPGATVKADLTALEFLEQVRQTQQHWIEDGTNRESRIPGLRHNVSNTISVKPMEWNAVADYLWKHRKTFAGVSTLPDDGDQVYPFAPFEAVKTPEQERRWTELATLSVTVDYSAVPEFEDNTALSAEAACAGGACEWKP